MQGLVQSTQDEASKSPTLKMGLKGGEPILIHLIQAVEDMTQVYCLGLLLLKSFIQLNDLFYQFRVSGLEDVSPTYVLFIMNQGFGKALYYGQGHIWKVTFWELGFQEVTIAELLQHGTIHAGEFLEKKSFILARVLIRFWFKYSLQPQLKGR